MDNRHKPIEDEEENIDIRKDIDLIQKYILTPARKKCDTVNSNYCY